jgi:putative tricarboxylic transport membrane protein
VTPSADRRAGVVLLVLALAVAWTARDYRVAFIADPVGPRAFPLVAALLVAMGAVPLVLRPLPAAAWPRGAVRVRIATAAGALALYPLLLPWLGFIATTGSLMWVLALLFGGRGGRAALAAFGMALGMYVLFVYALGVPLPIGALFLARGA